MLDLIREVGAFAGIAAFVGLAVLVLLYFSQARDVRRLRENAEFLVEGEGLPATERAAAEPVPAAVASEEPAEAARAAAATAPNEAEAFRRAELARQAAERRQRFEQRRSGGGGAWFRDVPSTAVIVVGALILLAGIGFGATRLLDGDEGDSGTSGSGEKRACSPVSTKVAVLNGTAEAGLAASYARQLEQAGYERGPVTNTESAFDRSVVMFDQDSQQCAPEIASTAGLSSAPAEPMNQEIVGIAEGSQVAVVLGEDVAGESSGSESSAAEGTTDTTLGD